RAIGSDQASGGLLGGGAAGSAAFGALGGGASLAGGSGAMVTSVGGGGVSVAGNAGGGVHNLGGGASVTVGGDAMSANISTHTSQMIDIAQVQGQVHAQSVQKVGELADKNPQETVSIIRSWLHEAA
ncbi:MAG: hypothetical protein JO365_19465, partial [Bradyrhizobium sp.]|nr:hypothetical protein [Bradyrhizobium sp.]